MRDVNKLLKLFNKREKKKLLLLLMMMFVAAFLETIGIGLIVPLVSIVTNPEIIDQPGILNSLYEYFNFQSATSFIIFSILVLLLTFLIKNIYLLLFHYIQYKVIFNQQVKLSRRLLREYLIKPYTFHLQRNTSDLLRNVNEEVPKVFQGIVLSGFQLFTEILVISCILLLLLINAPGVTITASILLSTSVLLFYKYFRKKINDLGIEEQRVTGSMIKWVNQGLGASKEVKVSGKESFFVNAYSKQSQLKAKNNLYMRMMEQIPRLFIETLLVTIVLFSMLIIIMQGSNTTELITTMSLFAMAAFRLMPSINRVVAMITAIRYNRPALTVIYEDLIYNNSKENLTRQTTALINSNERIYKNAIRLTDITFRYPNQSIESIKNISLTIPIGKSVAFVGESGAGKTTLVDIILGLLEPDKGSVTVDNKPLAVQKLVWQQKIGYIPQVIFLSDDSIRGNVAFGIEDSLINDEEVWRSLEQAQLKQFVEDLPDQLETKVGERGVKLSGGQRQRIGIARSLYHNPEILFMDEATSALDNGTEKEIMKAIDGLKGDKTLIIIAHRLSTIENCDIVFKLNKANLVAIENKLNKTVIS
ncbi:ABC transporter [Salipaludibacillus keqinensis]|uniref:ABC transporter n=2 Tax=Salipaludibacillus keqinensis TaxID=2045207 RepID=A0A323TJE7_9BACI|nr:ABC transporter [Salipaludibacillus keqinensis]